MLAIKSQNRAIRGSGFGRVLDDLPYAATIANADNLLVYVNPAFTSLYGWHEPEILGLTPRFLVDRTFPGKDLAQIKREIAGASGSWCGNIENVSKAGRKLLIRLWTMRIRPEHTLPCLYHLGLTAPAAANVRPEEDFASRLAGSLLAERRDDGPATDHLPRSEQIENFRALGYSTKDIAQILGVAPNTINVALHRERKRAAAGRGRKM
jgi:PAS domain S-box-containing protein